MNVFVGGGGFFTQLAGYAVVVPHTLHGARKSGDSDVLPGFDSAERATGTVRAGSQ